MKTPLLLIFLLFVLISGCISKKQIIEEAPSQDTLESQLLPKLSVVYFKDSIYKSNIRSVQLFQEGLQLSYPVLFADSRQKLELHFDCFNKDHSYKMKVVAFSASGDSLLHLIEIEPDTLQMVEKKEFNHFFATFSPESDQSGNYLLMVYGDSLENIFFTKKFFIARNAAEIHGSIEQPAAPELKNTHQEVSLKVIIDTSLIKNPGSVKLKIIQNNNFRFAKEAAVALIEDNIIFFEPALFPAGKEFRKIQILESESNVIAAKEEVRAYLRYEPSEDKNGKFFIYPEMDAGYSDVTFSLPFPGSVQEDIFVVGAFNNWEMSDRNRMYYSFSEKAYKLTLPLKKGSYEYFFASAKPSENNYDLDLIEGHSALTKNEYLVLLYMGNELIGWKIIHN